MDFRRKALERLRAPDELDTAISQAKPRAWIVLAVIAVLLAGGAVWAVTGELARTVSAPGLLTHTLGVSPVQSPRSGVVVSVFAESDSQVPAGAPVMSIVADSGRTETIRAPFSGRVIGVLVTGGQYIAVGTTFMTIERTDNPGDRMVAVLFVDAANATFMQMGDVVDISVQSAPSQAFGVLRGSVTSIESFPQSRKQVVDFLGGNEALADTFTTHGPTVAVQVDLQPDPGTASGYRWSSQLGPPFRIDSQTVLTGYVRLPGERPIDWVLP